MTNEPVAGGQPRVTRDASGDVRGKPSPERLCPNCGAELVELKCKLLCPDRSCGYYMSCSDFY